MFYPMHELNLIEMSPFNVMIKHGSIVNYEMVLRKDKLHNLRMNGKILTGNIIHGISHITFLLH